MRRQGLGGNPRNSKIQIQNFIIVSVISLLCDCSSLKGYHPRHPPRAFPLWLLAPRCLCARITPRFLGRGSFLSPGRDYTLGLLRVFCPRHPHSTLFNIMFSISLSLRRLVLQFGEGTRPLVVDTLAEMPEAENINIF